jgi:type I restriction enzyme R subunit
MDLTILLYKNGYPPQWDEEVFERVLEQAENFKHYNNDADGIYGNTPGDYGALMVAEGS